MTERAAAAQGHPEGRRPGSHRLRIVLIAPFALSPKSTSRARTLPLAKALAARGHVTRLLIPPYDNPSEGGRRTIIDGVPVESLAVFRHVAEASPLQAVVQPSLAAALAVRSLALRPDVVHVCKPKAVTGLTQVLLWAWRGVAGRPRIVLDTDDWEGRGGWNEYESYPAWQKWLCDNQERWGVAHADSITAASRTLQTQAWSRGVPAARAVYLPNGLDPDDYAGWRAADGAATRRRLNLGDRPVLLLYTRFFEFAPERIVRVLARVHQRVPDVHLLVVGSGKFFQERTLAAEAERCGLRRAVTLTGFQPRDALPALLAAGDVALFPSDDNLANRAKCSAKLLEAMWLGIPVVADRVGQLAEYVQDERTGILSDPESEQTMADAALRLLQDRQLATRLAAAAQQRVETCYSWRTLAGRAEQAYAIALAQRR